MSSALDLWRQTAAKWSEVYGQVTDGQWEKPTPCDEWTVRQLVDHTLGWQAEGGRLIGADTAPGDDWDRIRAAFDALLADTSPLTGNVAEFGGLPKQNLVGFLTGDLLIHSWDLARSIGADETLPPDTVEATTVGLHHVPPALLRGINPLGQKMMATAVEVPDDASPQDKMLASPAADPRHESRAGLAARSRSDRRDRPGPSSVKRLSPLVPGGRCSRGS
jgi:uncharacterized protein (TIGR03086 family)